jgi:RecA/RadA recombinase
MKSTTSPEKKSKSARKPIIEKKKDKLSSSEYLGDDFFDDFAAEAKAMFKEDAIIPSGADDALLEVNGWIEMPAPVAEVMDIPGVPCGLITMIYGLPDCGKTTFANTALMNTQKDRGIAILFKTEDKYSLKRAEVMGINVKQLMILRPRTIEQVGDYVQDVMAIVQKKGWSNRKVTIVWDSLAATPCAAELNEKRSSFSMDAAKAIRGMLRKVSALIKESNIAFVIINQVYDNMNMFGKKTTPYGGKGPVYHSSIILSFAKIGRVRAVGKKEGDFAGIKTKIEVEKNHLGQPFKTGEFAIDHKGFIFDRVVEEAPSFLKELSDIDEDEETDEPTTELPKEAKRGTKAKGKTVGDGAVPKDDGVPRKVSKRPVRKRADASDGAED